jgi:putative ABC transport system substrate-binding protein
MRRRAFIGALGGAALLPVSGRAQPVPTRRLAILMVIADRPVARTWVVAVLDALRSAGWTEGQNLQVEVRFGASVPDRIQRYTDELLSLKPDVILAQGVVGAGALRRATTTVPVVFVQVQDPIGGGFVTNLARPDGNQTGFTNFDYAMMGKWLQLLKEAAPGLTRAMAIINPDDRTRWSGYSAALEKFAPPLGLRPLMAGVH